ncbi:12790_t:CDS:2 [Entrophospora sp. SA101]|nr:12790_t:CDS:2 [Entrophospora sp. SA101]
MPQLKKPTKKPVSPSRKAKPKIKSTALVKAKSPKNTLAYYQCMCHQSQKGSQPKKITQVAHECKHNALTINAKMSAVKAKAAQKIKAGYETMGQGLAELIAAKQKNGKEQKQLDTLKAELTQLKASLTPN